MQRGKEKKTKQKGEGVEGVGVGVNRCHENVLLRRLNKNPQIQLPLPHATTKIGQWLCASWQRGEMRTEIEVITV